MATGKRLNGEEITFVLLGVQGSGKSSTGNSILGNRDFKTGAGTVAVTTTCQQRSAFRFGKKVVIIDTPGLTNAGSLLQIRSEVEQIQARPQHGKIIFAITIKVGRYTEKEKSILEEIFKLYKSILINSILIFTNREELFDEDDPEDRTINSWIERNPSLRKLIKGNKLRFFEFQNKGLMEAENNNQVGQLLSVVGGLGVDEESFSPGSVKTNKTICVDREWMIRRFGEAGKQAFDEEFALQNK